MATRRRAQVSGDFLHINPEDVEAIHLAVANVQKLYMPRIIDTKGFMEETATCNT